MTATAEPATARIDCTVVSPPGPVRGLEVIEGPDRGRRLRLPAGLAVLGTHAQADLRLSDPTVSRRHLEVRVRGDRLELVDLGALNGVFVDEQRILHALVGADARIRVGRTVLRAWRDRTRLAPDPSPLRRLVAVSPRMRELVALLRMLAGRREPVVLLGPPGVGRTRVAEVVHALGAARSLPLRPCTPDTLAEVGSDEVPLVALGGDFDHARLQSDLQSRDGPWLVTLDPEASADAAGLAERLGALGAFEIPVPELSARREDLPQLVAELLVDLGHGDHALGPEALGRIQARAWPGQIPELKAYLRNLVSAPQPRPRARTERIVGSTLPYKAAKAQMIEAFEKEYVALVLEQNGGNISRAARLAGIDRVYLHRLMKKHGLQGELRQ